MTREPSVPSGIDGYLFPAVVGGGLGDIEEVLAAGRVLASGGIPLYLYRSGGGPLPRDVAGPWEWPVHRRVRAIPRRSPRAVTLGAWWGVSAARARDEPLGRAGPWAEEARQIDDAYGVERVLHVSFEEFARTLTSRRQAVERLREGGIPDQEIRRRLRSGGLRDEIRVAHDAYRRFRAFDEPHVLHLFTGFHTAPAFRREFPESVVVGPLWPRATGRAQAAGGRTIRARATWVWYASPSSSARLAERLGRALSGGPMRTTLAVRSPRRFPLPEGTNVAWRWVPASSPEVWRRRFARADLRIATGSRTLLEALELGRPFLYFNGILGSGARTRRHRPEKIDALLRVWKRTGVRRSLLRDLSDFSRARRVEAVARAARADPRWGEGFPRQTLVAGFRAPYHDVAELLLATCTAFASGRWSSSKLVQRIREGKLDRAGAGRPGKSR